MTQKRQMPKIYLTDNEVRKYLQAGGEDLLYMVQSRKADEAGDGKTAWE